MKFKEKDIVLVTDPLRLYIITDIAYNGYHMTYIGPGTQNVDNALISVAFRSTKHFRLATKAEIVLYKNSGVAAEPL